MVELFGLDLFMCDNDNLFQKFEWHYYPSSNLQTNTFQRSRPMLLEQEHLLEMQIREPHSRLLGLETPWLGVFQLCLTGSAGAWHSSLAVSDGPLSSTEVLILTALCFTCFLIFDLKRAVCPGTLL